MTTPPLPQQSVAHVSNEAKEANEALLNLAVEVADIGLWDLDLVTDRLEFSPCMRRMFGLTPHEPITRERFRAMLHPDDRERVMQAVASAQDSHRRPAYEVEYRVVSASAGDVRWVAAKGRGVFDAAGRCVRLLGAALDITQRRHAQEQQHQTSERLALLDLIGLATRTVTDAAQVMQLTARILGEHLGATRCAYADVEPDNDRFTIRADWSLPGVASSAGTYSLDLFGPQATFKLRRGQHLIVNDVDRELGDEGGGRMFNAIGIKAIICAGLVKGGKLVAMMAVHQATPREWSEHDVRVVGEVVDRCWAHIERVRTSAMLLEQDRRKDEFLATLAHELRNPLAPLMYATTILQKVDDAVRRDRALAVIERQTGQLARLIDDLLDVSRINRGLVELKRQPNPIAPLLHQALEASKPALDAAGHRVSVSVPDETAVADVDPARIVQAVTNLLNNAAKYTPDGGQVRLSAWVEGDRIVVEVADNGIGIPLQDQSKVFQLFTQLAHAGMRSQGGLGIGLSLVKRLVELHGGQVSVHSDGLDEGSTFRIELARMPAPTHAESPNAVHAVDIVHAVHAAQAAQPAHHGKTAQTAQTSQTTQIAHTAPISHSAQAHAPGSLSTGTASAVRILVVEDNKDGLATLLELLTAHGHDARGASTGPQALRLVRSWRPDIVLLDLGLPLMDGYEVAMRLRQDTGLIGVRLIALTGWGAQRDRERTAQAGFDAHLTKPVAPARLLAAIGEWMSSTAAAPQ